MAMEIKVADDWRLIELEAALTEQLLHDDFAQGAALQMLPKETLVQTWTAGRLRNGHQHLYSVERESRVAARSWHV